MSDENKNNPAAENDPGEGGEGEDAGGGAQGEKTGKARRHQRRKGDVSAPESNSQAWLVSFTDVMALMLTFFVLLFSMSHPKEEAWSEMTAALKDQLYSVRGGIAGGGALDVINIGRMERNQALSINYVSALLENLIRDNDALGNLVLEKQQKRVMLSIPYNDLFEGEDGVFRDDGAAILYALGGALSPIKNQIEIVGKVTPSSASGGNSWVLSMRRAVDVAATLKNVGYQKDITIRTGHMREAGNVSYIDIIILDHDGRQAQHYTTRTGR